MSREPHAGVYRLIDSQFAPMQVIVTSRLAGESYPEFKALAKGFTREDIEKLLLKMQEMDDPNYTNYVKAVLNVSVAINEPIFEEIKKEDSAMSEAVERLFREEFEEREAKGKLEQAKETAVNLYRMGMGVDRISQAVNVKADQIEQWLGLVTA